MAAPIRIGGLDADEAEDLARALGARGIVGTPAARGKRSHVDIRDTHEDTERLLADVRAALELWLAEHGRDSATVHVGDERCTVDAVPSVADFLRKRIRASAARTREPS